MACLSLEDHRKRMQIVRKRDWELPEALITPEPVFISRRQFVAGTGLLAIAAATGLALATRGTAAAAGPPLYPAPRNPAYADAGRPVTPEELNTTYNNF
jgi:methionine sulfoxide reductase catalytic subunit